MREEVDTREYRIRIRVARVVANGILIFAVLGALVLIWLLLEPLRPPEGRSIAYAGAPSGWWGVAGCVILCALIYADIGRRGMGQDYRQTAIGLRDFMRRVAVSGIMLSVFIGFVVWGAVWDLSAMIRSLIPPVLRVSSRRSKM
jgi:hypothetical protein